MTLLADIDVVSTIKMSQSNHLEISYSLAQQLDIETRREEKTAPFYTLPPSRLHIVRIVISGCPAHSADFATKYV